MNIAIFGYFNRRNAGDDRIMEAWMRLLPGHQCTFMAHYSPPPPSVMRHYDLILIGGGGLVWEHIGIWKDVVRWTRRTGVPVGVAGLGVNAVNAVLFGELHELIEYSEFFFVRDQESHRLLNFHPKVQVFPDLTWTCPFPPRLEARLPRRIACNLCTRAGIDACKFQKLLEDEITIPLPLNFARGQDYYNFEENTPAEVPDDGFVFHPSGHLKYL